MSIMTSLKIKSIIKIIPIITVSFMLYSCDCIQNVSGIVLDKTTKKPIDSAYIQNAIKNYDYSYTDRNGYFELKSISGGFRKCPPMGVAITKQNYEIKIVEIENSGQDTIYLERIR